MLIISVIKPIFLIGKWKKIKFSKLHLTTKILIVYLIKNSSLFYFLPKKWWSCGCFFFPASEAPKNFWGPQKRFKFWILDLKVCLKKQVIGPGLYGKSVLYLMYRDSPDSTVFAHPGNRTIEKTVLYGDCFRTKIRIYDFWNFKVPFFCS